MSKQNWTEDQVKLVLKLKAKGMTRNQIAEGYNAIYPDEPRTPNSIGHAVAAYKDHDFSERNNIDNINKNTTLSKHKSKVVNENRLIRNRLLDQTELLQEFENIVKENPIKTYKPVKLKRSRTKTERVIVAHVSDMHFHSNIDDEEMAGLNKYGPIEEARRLAFLTKEIADYKIHRRHETELLYVINGDIIAGIIHNIESYPAITTQIAAATSLLSQSISYLSTVFKKVKVIGTTGNHCRVMHKGNKSRQTKQKWDSYATLVYSALKATLNNHKNVEIEIPVAPFFYGKVLGHDFFITHSDTVINVGYPGKSINVERAKNVINDLKEGIGNIDVVMVGHVHVDTKQLLQNGVVLLTNGSMSGIDEFALSIGITTNNPTQQIFEVTKAHKVGDLRSVALKDADKDSSLDKLIKPFVTKF